MILVDDVVGVIDEEAQEDLLSLNLGGESDLLSPPLETASAGCDGYW